MTYVTKLHQVRSVRPSSPERINTVFPYSYLLFPPNRQSISFCVGAEERRECVEEVYIIAITLRVEIKGVKQSVASGNMGMGNLENP